MTMPKSEKTRGPAQTEGKDCVIIGKIKTIGIEKAYALVNIPFPNEEWWKT